MKRNILVALVLLLTAVVAAAGSRPFMIVVDAGHGGQDKGACGLVTNEKDIVLGVALKVGDLISRHMNDAKVVYTRSNDTFVTLGGRSKIANDRRADIFVSIHANSVAEENPRRMTIRGSSVFVGGAERTPESMRENAAMRYESNSDSRGATDHNSPESYIAADILVNDNLDRSIDLAMAIQRKLTSEAGREDCGVRQADFAVLRNAAMPAVLVELDFICNPDMEKYMASDEGQNALAEAIYSGIKTYRAKNPGSSPAKQDRKQGKKSDSKTDRKSDKKTQPASPAADDEIVYKVQFMTSGRVLEADDPRLNGVPEVDHYGAQGMIKYTSGAFTSMDDARKRLRELRKRFPDAFIITTRGGVRI